MKYPLSDLSGWFGGALAALANLSIGNANPQPPNSTFSVEQFSVLSCEASLLSANAQPPSPISSSNGLDVHNIFATDWVRQLLFNVGNYIFERRAAGICDADSATRVTLALIFLGVRHERLMLHQGTTVKNFADLLIGQNSDVLEMPSTYEPPESR